MYIYVHICNDLQPIMESPIAVSGLLYTGIYIYTYIYMYIRIYVYIYICIYIYIYIYTCYIQVYTYLTDFRLQKVYEKRTKKH
jgi:hypothetical protein